MTRQEMLDISTHTLTWSVTIDDSPNTDTMTISTHTLTWSVTRHSERQNKKCKISTHTLTWSVTPEEIFAEYCKEFQLTRSRGA